MPLTIKAVGWSWRSSIGRRINAERFPVLFLLEEVSSKWHNNFINIIHIILTSQLPIIYGRALHSIWVFRKRMWIILWKPIVKKFFPFLSYPINKTTVVVYVVSILSLLFLAIIAYICLPYHISALENRRKNNESCLCRSHTVVGWVAPYFILFRFCQENAVWKLVQSLPRFISPGDLQE